MIKISYEDLISRSYVLFNYFKHFFDTIEINLKASEK